MEYKKILAINAGSSSIKFKVYNYKTLAEEASGLCERIFIDGSIKIEFNGKQHKKDISMPNHETAISIAIDEMISLGIIKDISDIAGLGHRIVMGGSQIKESTIMDDKNLEIVERCIKLAPLHNGPECEVIKIFKTKLPNVINVGVYDTSFHTTIPQINYDYALDRETTKKYEIRRYGMHGTSYRYIALKAQEVLNKKGNNLIICHLGNGASICAVKNDESYNTSMGLTPLEGLIMGTRCGDIDGAVALYLIRQGMSVDQVENEFNKKGGLLGISGFSDGRDVQASRLQGNKNSILAREMQTNRVADYIVRYINQLDNQVDAIIFTAGIGENDHRLIQEVCDKIKVKNIKINQDKNTEKYGDYILISADNSDIPVYKIRTNEELMIAQDTKRLLNN